MTDLMELAEAYAWHSVHGAATNGESVIGARDALQEVIEALQEKNALLEGTLESRERNISELQAENERLKAEREKDAFRLVWAMNWMRMSVHDHGFTKHVLERGGTADYSDCATYIDKCTTVTQESARGIHAKGGQQ